MQLIRRRSKPRTALAIPTLHAGIKRARTPVSIVPPTLPSKISASSLPSSSSSGSSKQPITGEDSLDAFMQAIGGQDIKFNQQRYGTVSLEDIESMAQVDDAVPSHSPAPAAPAPAAQARTEPTTEPAAAPSSAAQAVGGSIMGTLEDELLQEDDSFADFDASQATESKGMSALQLWKERQARKQLALVNHAEVTYAPFTKAFYIEHPAIAAMSDEDARLQRKAMGMTVRGRHVPRPIVTWEHAGLSSLLLSLLDKAGFAQPFAIQRQALPVLMSGRDLIGVAKTGSGKTLAYVLPMLRHVLDQPPLQPGEGPMAVIMAPARELVTQVAGVAKLFAKHLQLRVAAIYGGASVTEQIAAIKRGAEIVVCTPGRMIDMLTLNGGRLLDLRRVTYMVLDEADRMFDQGFEPQIMRILGNTRPDRQTALFSATFPKQVEQLARKTLASPVEIVVGGRSVSNASIDQSVEVRDAATKFRRLLQLLGQWHDHGRILVFVDTRERADLLFAELLRAEYPCLVLHSGMDQYDRENSIAEFKHGEKRILVATSLAGRGLDVPDLILVVNYCAPSHLEDYVHRIGRTGRAGRHGTAITFITPDEAAYSPDLVRALKESNVQVPAELAAMAAEHEAAVARGDARKRKSGYATRGYHFDDDEMSEMHWETILAKTREAVATGNAEESALDEALKSHAAWRAAQHTHGAGASGSKLKRTPSSAEAQPEADAADTAPADEPDSQPVPAASAEQIAAAEKAAMFAQTRAEAAARAVAAGSMTALQGAQLKANALAAANALQALLPAVKPRDAATLRAEAEAAANAALAASGHVSAAPAPVQQNGVTAELEINDYPDKARRKVQLSSTADSIYEMTGCSVTSRGHYCPPGKTPQPGTRKLYLYIEGPDNQSVAKARAEARRLVEEITRSMAMNPDQRGMLL